MGWLGLAGEDEVCCAVTYAEGNECGRHIPQLTWKASSMLSTMGRYVASRALHLRLSSRAGRDTISVVFTAFILTLILPADISGLSSLDLAGVKAVRAGSTLAQDPLKLRSG